MTLFSPNYSKKNYRFLSISIDCLLHFYYILTDLIIKWKQFLKTALLTSNNNVVTI